MRTTLGALAQCEPATESSTQRDHLLDNRSTASGGRFAALSELFDGVTERHLDTLEIGARFGRTLPARLRELRLTGVAADAFFPVALPAAASLEAANVTQLRDGLLACGHATADEIDGHLAALAAGLDISTPPLVSCREWRPVA
jgi:hypothetical protein